MLPAGGDVQLLLVGFHDQRLSALPARIQLDDNADIKAEPEECLVKNINPYLVAAPDLFVDKRMKPLADLPEVRFGSKPTDGGFLIVEPEDYDSVMADPIAAKYVRPFRMGRELIHGKDRWCLWLVDATSEEIAASSILSERTAAVRQFRLNSRKVPTQRKAETPHLFDENHQPVTSFVALPAVFSEGRKWATVAHLTPDVIAGNKLYLVVDPDGFAFAIISSLMFMTWQKMIGGRLKSDPNFSNTVVWNNLPLPVVSEKDRVNICELGKDVLAARQESLDQSLSTMYAPEKLRPDLVAAHERLDQAVDALFGLGGAEVTDVERQQVLVASFHALTSTAL